jgi:hypothetical protein
VKTEEAITPAMADDAGDRLPLAMEATEGIAPVLTTHKEGIFGAGGELSPEEEAIQGAAGGSGPVPDDEDDDTAALAEGRMSPPASGDSV